MSGSYTGDAAALVLVLAVCIAWLAALRSGKGEFAALAGILFFVLATVWDGASFVAILVSLHVMVLLSMDRLPRRYNTDKTTC